MDDTIFHILSTIFLKKKYSNHTWTHSGASSHHPEIFRFCSCLLPRSKEVFTENQVMRFMKNFIHLSRQLCSKKLNLELNAQLTATGNLPVTYELKVVDTLGQDKWPVYRVLDVQGKLLLDKEQSNTTSKEVAEKMYKTMIRTQAIDDIFYNAQRQGRISFYMQNSGEEATHVGSAAALKHDDIIFAQYRELGVLLYRGFTVQQAADQCFSNEDDLGKGRQMPVHYGCRVLK